MQEGVVDQVRAAGGEVYAITSEPQRLADDAKENWELNFQTVGDPHHEISAACVERDWLQLIVNEKTDLFEKDPAANFSHPKGYFQPGVLAVDSKGRVLYRWRGIPTRSNMGGAMERPTATHVFEKMKEALAAGQSAGDAELDRDPVLDARGIPWPIFASVLTANGWFVRPKTFTHMPNGPSLKARFIRALLRIPIFLAGWGLAFMFLPTLFVGAALAVYAMWITPKIRYISDQFQTVDPSDY
ncbi:MAG: hypothetical protein AB8C02_17300 [Halioglobus sp.]